MGYTPLRISTIKPERQINFDLYIHFKEQFLCYIKNGASLETDHLGKLRKQKIAKFYITDVDEPNYQSFLDTILKEAIESDTIPVEEKVELAEGAAGTAVERMQKDPGNKVAYSMTEKAASSLRQIVSKNPSALKKIFGKKAAKHDMVIKHSLNVCALACKMGEIMGLSNKQLDDLGTAALIHDIGLTKLGPGDQHLINKPRKNFTPDEKRIFGFHTKDSATMLADKSYVNKEIIDLVLNHEENHSGTGPLKKPKPTEIESILSLADCYDLRISVGNMTPKEAIKEVQIDELGNYELDMINKLKSILKTEGMLD